MTKSHKTALFLSPHLDDAVFSCGATMAKLADENWRTILCTVFTKSVLDPQGFALACQTDKNLSADVDYMNLRRAEDRRAAAILNVAEILHSGFLEAPHRGYDSAAELFAGIKTGDDIWCAVAEYFRRLDRIHQPQIVFAPQGLGGHCDHLQTIDAALAAFEPEKILWYRDTPYAVRQPEARPSAKISFSAAERSLDIAHWLERKITACAQYETQINFQFGGRDNLEKELRGFHRNESLRLNRKFAACENFLVRTNFDYGIFD